MSVSTSSQTRSKVVYPDSDGQPMAENTLQFEWIVTIKEGIEAVFLDRQDVFVAGDLLWYPVEGDPKIRIAPDAMVAFGRPKGYRGSYKQWEEGGIAPQVVFEVLSPGNRFNEMLRKHRFYELFGVEEYYLYNPDEVDLFGWLRRGEVLEEIVEIKGWTSPRLGVRFDLTDETLEIIGPDGRPFLTYSELFQQRNQLEQQRDQLERQRAEESRRAERLAAQLRSLGAEPEA